MKKPFTLIALFVLFLSNVCYASPNTNIQLELYLMRKGNDLSIAIIHSGTELPTELIIERKSTAPLSKYRKIIILDNLQISQFKQTNKLLLKDKYPVPRQLDSYYRLKYTTEEGVVRTLPPTFLSRATNGTSVTFGDHEQNESIFEKEEKNVVVKHEAYSISLAAERDDNFVTLTIDATNQNVEGEWTIERKTSKPLSSYRRVKTILDEDLEAVKKGAHQIYDIYPESRKLDAYYRLVITDKDGNRIEFPSIFLKGERAH